MDEWECVEISSRPTQERSRSASACLRSKPNLRRQPLPFGGPRLASSSAPTMAITQRITPWNLSRGARPEGSGIRFEVWAPRARRVRVRLLTGQARGDHLLGDVDRRGYHAGYVEDASPGDDYMFVFDDDRTLPDPVSRWQPRGVHGPSRIVDPNAFEWTDDDWRGIGLA